MQKKKTISFRKESSKSDDDTMGVVTIVDNPTEIREGETFIVYLQDLPIGYVAKSVREQDNKTVIEVERADKSVYALLDEEGVIEITTENSEVIAAEGVTLNAAPTFSGSDDDGFTYKEGKFIFTYSLNSANLVQVWISDLNLSHSFSEAMHRSLPLRMVFHGKRNDEKYLICCCSVITDITPNY